MNHFLPILLATTLIAGCSSGPSPAERTVGASSRDGTPTRVTLDPPLIIAQAGRPIVVPLEPGLVPTRVDVTSVEGTRLESRILVSVVRRPVQTRRALVALDAARWVDRTPGDQHLVLTPDRLRETDRVLADSVRAFLVIEPPASAPEALVISGLRTPVRFEPTEVEAPLPAAVLEPTAEASQQRSIWYEHASDRLRDDPTQRWRERLMTGTLFESRRTTGDAKDLVATHLERRWRVALTRVAEADPATARALIETLATVVSFGDGVAAPMWLTNRVEEANLQRDLLLATSPDDASQRARAWLIARATAAAWVVDDAGARDAVRDTALSTVAAVVLRGESTVGWTRTPNAPATMFPMPLRRAIRMVGSAQPDAISPTSLADAMLHAKRGLILPARVGTVNCDRRVFAVPFPIHPPGMRAGPFFREFSRSSLAGIATRLDAPDLPATDDATPIDREAPTAALLSRASGPHDSPADGWSLFIECAGRVPERDLLRVWLGRFESPTLVLEIEPSGRVRDMTSVLGDRASEIERINARVTQTDDRWNCWIDLPPATLGGTGAGRFVQLGLERFATGRSSWPRPMLPWQTEPGRVLVDLSTWSDLGTGAPDLPVER